MTADFPRLLSVAEAADRLGVSISFLNKSRMTPGVGPRFVRLGTRIAYRPDDLAAWVAQHTCDSTADRGDEGAA